MTGQRIDRSSVGVRVTDGVETAGPETRQHVVRPPQRAILASQYDTSRAANRPLPVTLRHSRAAMRPPSRRHATPPRRNATTLAPPCDTPAPQRDHPRAATRPLPRRHATPPCRNATTPAPPCDTPAPQRDHPPAATRPPSRRHATPPRRNATDPVPQRDHSRAVCDTPVPQRDHPRVGTLRPRVAALHTRVATSHLGDSLRAFRCRRKPCSSARERLPQSEECVRNSPAAVRNSSVHSCPPS